MIPPRVTIRGMLAALGAFAALAWFMLRNRNGLTPGAAEEAERAKRKQAAEAEAIRVDAAGKRHAIAAELKAKVAAAKARREEPEDDVETINRWAGGPKGKT